jgi:hypothetical protein
MATIELIHHPNVYVNDIRRRWNAPALKVHAEPNNGLWPNWFTLTELVHLGWSQGGPSTDGFRQPLTVDSQCTDL